MPWFPPPSSLLKSALILTAFLSSSGLFNQCFAERLTVTAEGEYILGDHDTKEDGTRLAIEAAQRHALEQVVTYVESVTTATALDITRDEIRTYTAGVVVVSDQRVSTRLDGDQIIIHVDLTAQIDPEEAAQAVITLRQNDDARQQLQLLRTEVDDLHQQLQAATEKLAAATSPEHVLTAGQQRQDLLNRVQSDTALTQAWTDWALMSSTAYPSPWIGISRAQGLWAQAFSLYPMNPHLVVLQQRLPMPVASIPAAASMSAAAPQFRSSRARNMPQAATTMVSPSTPPRHLPPMHRLPPILHQVPSAPPAILHRPPFHMPFHSAPRSGGGGGRGRR